MSTKLFITSEGLQQAEENPENRVNPVLKALANFLSYLFHPVFVPLYVIAFILFVEPFLFVGASAQEKILTLGRAFINYTFFPLISVLLLKGLNLISSIKLKERKDRIVPFIVCNIWYFWIWYVWRGLPGVPHHLVVFSLGVFLASSMGLLANIYLKISMHAIALGTATAFLCLLTFDPSSSNITIYLALAIFITGIVGSSRLILSEHTPREYYMGLGVGVLAVLVANLVA
ncbi:hypothetical protein [Niabella ginsengisoli]|uniref:Phosphatase PAP2 family protein n=1 Tax=Niabella ginsengisoli TaxID=522298 RepID=A0ABS9SMM3_9BACT|nr:hypothetical protein [Niabella ginsengisoli]MCH5599617.1 hypothetical protein [Niabella ginsengisoli]